MSAEGATPGRRLTDDEAARGADLFANGATETEVAAALDCSRSTAHRLRLRLSAGQEDGDAAAMASHETEMLEAETAAYRAELLDALSGRRDQLASVLGEWQQRATAARAAIDRYDAERLELLGQGKDPAHLRPQRAQAEADLGDAVTAAGLIGAQLAEADMRIGAVRAEQQAEDARAAAEEAARAGDELAPQAEAALKAAVTGDGAVKALTDLAVRLVAAERASGRSWDAQVLPPSLRLLGSRDPWHWAVSDLWRAARQGNVAAVMAILPRCSPWIDRDRAEFAAMHADAQRRAEEMRQQSLSSMARQPQPPAHGAATRIDFIATMREAALRAAAERPRHETAADLMGLSYPDR